MRALIALAFVFASLAPTAISADVGPPVDVATRAKGAGRIVVATIVGVESFFDVNAFGDRIIVSQAQADVQETLKGRPTPWVLVTVEGGTVGDLTMRVSDMPTLRTGERAVFLLDESPSGSLNPHRRGLGILKLDESDRVEGSSLTLDEIRRIVQNAGN